MKALLLPVGLLLAAGTTTSRADGGAQSAGQARRLQGTWVLSSFERGRGPQPTAGTLERGEVQMVFEGEEFSVTMYGARREGGRFRLDPRRSPREITIHSPEGEHRGIYRLDGEILMLHVAHPGVERPTAFRMRPGQLTTLLIGKRRTAQNR